MTGDGRDIESTVLGSIHKQSAMELIGQSLVMLSNLAELGALEPSQKLEVSAAMNRLWLAIRELEQGTSGSDSTLM